jgi:hypothetical protein
MCYIMHPRFVYFYHVDPKEGFIGIIFMDTNPTQSSNTPATDKEGFIFRPKWFLITRYIAVGCIVVAILVSKYFFQITTVNYHALWLMAGLLLLTNIAYTLYYSKSCISKGCKLGTTEKKLSFFT